MSLIAIVGIWMLVGLISEVLVGVAFGIYEDKTLGTEANDFELIDIYFEELGDIAVFSPLVRRIMGHDSTVSIFIGLILSLITECALWPFVSVRNWSAFKRAISIYRSRHENEYIEEENADE